MFRLAHISDVHLAPLPQPGIGQLFNKRITGYLNWQRRKHNLVEGILERLIEDLKAKEPDHLAITGDLINLSLPAEIENAAKFLEQTGDPDWVTAIMGNHDAYVAGAREKAIAAWQPYLSGDGSALESVQAYPVLRKRGDVSIIACNSAITTPPFFATGKAGEDQLHRLANMLAELDGTCRVLLIHHPPFGNATPFMKRLIDADRFRNVVANSGAELILHGHTHLDTLTSIDGKGNKVPVVCVPAAGQAPGGHKPAAGYNLFNIDKKGDEFSITLDKFRYSENSDKPVHAGNFEL